MRHEVKETNAKLVWDFNETFQRKQLEPLASLLDKGEKAKLKSQLALIKEEVQELEDAIEAGDWVEMKDAVADILVVTYGMGYVMSIDCDKAVQEVNRSNMSKICQNIGEVSETQIYYAESRVDTTHSQIGETGTYIVKSARDQHDELSNFFPEGKFLKNVNWTVPNLDFIEV